jgi:cytidine deaminase
MAELLPHAFGREDLDTVAAAADVPQVPAQLARWRGRGTVFVHPDMSGGNQVWTGYWERAAGATGPDAGEEVGILEEGPIWTTAADGVTWGRVRTPRVVVVDAEGGLSWAGEGTVPDGIEGTWSP